MYLFYYTYNLKHVLKKIYLGLGIFYNMPFVYYISYTNFYLI